MKSNELEPDWRLDRLSVRTVCTEQWRHVTDSNEPGFVSTPVAKVYSHFKVSNVNKVDIFVQNRINSTCMLFLSMYTFIILTMRLCAQANSCPKEVNEARVADTQTHGLHRNKNNHVTFVNLNIQYYDSVFCPFFHEHCECAHVCASCNMCCG